MGELKLLKPVHKLKYCIEKTYEVELQSSDSDLDENHKEDMSVDSVLCHVGRTARNNQKIHFLYRTDSNFNPNPPSPQKEKKGIRCLEPLSKEEQSIKKRAF